MNVEFDWNGLKFRADCELDNDPEGYADFIMNKLFLTDGKVEIDVTSLLLCDELCNELNDVAYAAYRAELKYERSFP